MCSVSSLARAAIHALLAGGMTSGAAEGPGFPNVGYDPAVEGTVLSMNDPGKALSGMTMHRGYLFVPLGADHGGGQGTGAFAFYDVSDPTNVVTHLDSRDHSGVYHQSGLTNHVGDWAEIHHLPVSGDLMMISERRSGSAGYSIFDVSNLYDEDPNTLPQIVSRYSYSGVTSPTNYDGYSFALGWQGSKYLYAPTGSNGLHIIDTSNLASPQELAVIPKSALSNLTLRSAVPIGNLLVLTTTTGGPAGTMTAAFYDISVPDNPQQLNTLTGPIGYQSFVYGSKLYGGGFPLEEHDFSDPQNIVTTTLNTAPGYDRPEYGFGKDGHIFVGHYPGMTKWLLNGTSTTQVQAVNSGIVDDHAFITPLGNLIILSSDHNNSRKLTIGVHDHNQDTTPPAVNFVSPADGETEVAVTSRVGLCFTDFIDQASVDSGSLVVREFGGAQVPGTYSTMFGIVNFAPDGVLDVNTTYEVVLTAGGVADQSGNAIASETLVAQFSTGSAVATYGTTVVADAPVETGQSANLTGTINNPEGFSLEHAWDYGDGTPMTAYGAATTATHAYATPGNHVVTFFTRLVGSTYATQSTAVQVVHNPLAAEPPVNSSTIVHDDANGLVWNVNPDNDTVTAIDDDTPFAKVYETTVGADPKTLALGPGNTLWVANKGDATLSVINRATGAISATHALPYASAPHAIVVDVPNGFAYVSLEGTGQLAKVDAGTGNVTATLAVGPWPRNLALDASRDTLWVARFISPDAEGRVTSVDTNTFAVTGVSALSHVFDADSLSNGRGLPNYLAALAVSPDATQAFVPSKKDNIFRGILRDGLPLTFEHSVRSMATRIDLSSGLEDVSQRIDFDNSDMATAAAFSPLGNQVFYTTSGSETIWVVDAFDRNSSFTFATGGRAPAGLALHADGSRLFVHNFMSRSVTVFGTSASCASFCGTAPQLADVSTVVTESLAPEVLLGKQLFYDSNDPRLAQEGYMSCASCHLDGGHDGRIWDFTGFGEGLRTTIDLNGRGSGHGPAHWTANFDEVHDFEGQIRGFASGSGLMDDDDFNEGTRSEPLGLAKAGQSGDLDALAAYVGSLTTVGKSPHRNSDGSLTADALAGRAIFVAKNCASCHSGTPFTDSASLARHDVGTLTAASGARLGGPLDGLDTPTLRGLWKGAPYLHDGSAMTLEDVLVDRNIAGLHGVLFDLNTTEIGQLAAYLRQIDDLETVSPAGIANGVPVLTDPGPQTTALHQSVALALSAIDPETDPLSWQAMGLPPGLAIDPATGIISGAPGLEGEHTVTIAVRDAYGDHDSATFAWTIDEAALSLLDLASPTGPYRYLRLTTCSEVTGGPGASIAEFNVLDGSGSVMNRSGWTVSASIAAPATPAANAIDGNSSSLWSTVGASGAETLIDPTTNNGSFEYAGGVLNTSKIQHWDTSPDIDNWTLWTELSTASNDSGVENTGFASDGTMIAFLQTGNAVYNMTTHVIEEGDIFDFSWDHVRQSNREHHVSLVWDDGGTITAFYEIPWTGTLETVTGSYTVQPGDPWIGSTVGIGIRCPYGYPEVDNFILTVNGDAGHPHHFEVDMGASVAITGVTILPDASSSTGRIEDYALHGSNDGLAWNLIQAGSLPDSVLEQTLPTSGATGGITREWWLGISGNPVANLTASPDFPDNPDGSEILGLFEGPSSFADSYGTRMHGYLVPEVSGTYSFAIAADDEAELWLGANQLPESTTLVATVPSWTSSRQWDKYPSDQISAPVALEGGKLYYIQALHKEGNGGDNLAVGWIPPGGSSFEVIPGGNLIAFETMSAPPVFDSPSYAFSVAENAPLATAVGTVSATDANAGQTLAYSIVSGNAAGAFAIDPASGAITVDGPLDYETQPVHHLLVQAVDDGTEPAASTVGVTVTTNNVLESNHEVVTLALSGAGGPYEGHGNPALIGFSMDPDNDGLASPIELLLGTDPSSSDVPAPIRFGTEEAGGKVYALYEFDVDAAMDDLLAFHCVGSSDLGVWLNITNPPVLVGESGGVRTYRVRDDVAMETSSKRFVRISIAPGDAK